MRFPKAIRLTDGQAAMSKELLNKMGKGDRWTLISELAGKVPNSLGIQGDGLRDAEFLQAVLKDHVYLSSAMAPQPWGSSSAERSAH